MTAARPYTPIQCDLVDELHIRAMRSRDVTLRFAENGVTTERGGVITDVFTKDGAEFLTLADGLKIRLDDLIEVDGISFGGAC